MSLGFTGRVMVVMQNGACSSRATRKATSIRDVVEPWTTRGAETSGVEESAGKASCA
jgi:hypothetical protein